MDDKVRAARAKAILQDDVFKEAVSVVKGYHTGTFLNVGSSQDEIMEAHRMVRALALIQGQLQSFVDTGRLLERKQKGSAT